MTVSSLKTWQGFKTFLFVLFSASRKYHNFLQRSRRENFTHLSSYENTKFGIEGKSGFMGEAASGSPWMKPQEEKQDSGVVQDALEFNWEHVRMNRGSEGIPLWVASWLQSLKVGFFLPHLA